jgi:hypothetical protein
MMTMSEKHETIASAHRINKDTTSCVAMFQTIIVPAEAAALAVASSPALQINLIYHKNLFWQCIHICNFTDLNLQGEPSSAWLREQSLSALKC